MLFRSGLTHGRAVVARIQPLVVNPMPALVQDAEERVPEIMLVVARRDPRVAGSNAAAKGVRSDVEPAVVKIEQDGFGGFSAERLLLGKGVTLREDLDRRFGRRIDDPLQQIAQGIP